MAFDKNYIWEGRVLSRQIGIVHLTADDELVGDIEEGSCVWPSEWIRVWCDGTDQVCDSIGNDCEEQIEEEDTITWGQAGEWEEAGEYDLSLPVDELVEEDNWREDWKKVIAALRIFVKVVDDPAMWEALVRRFPALYDAWEDQSVEDPSWRRLCRLMDPPRDLRSKLPLSCGLHYGAWQKYKGARDPGFHEWIRDLLPEVEYDDLFEEVVTRLKAGYFDI